MDRIRRAMALGVVTGIVGLLLSTIPSIVVLEDTIGLRWLFRIRGPVAPPREVTIVSIDEAAATRMGLPERVREWPRSVHAALVDRLVERGASTIVFDIEFFNRRVPADDDVFAQSIAKARRVVLVQRLEFIRAGTQELWGRQNPIPALADAAFALAPVPVPDTSIVTWFWSFLREPESSDGPSLPAVALQVHTLDAIGPFLDLLERAGVDGLADLPRTGADIRTSADLLRLMRTVRRQVLANPAAASTAMTWLRGASPGAGPAEHRTAITTLVAMYDGPDSAYLNFYGPPGTVCTVPYDRVLKPSGSDDIACALRDSIVFVGVGTGRVTRADQDDTYHTVYESADGVDFSGVELHATAAANLLTRGSLRPPPQPIRFAVVLLLGIGAGAGVYLVRTRRRRVAGRFSARMQAAVLLASFAALYTATAYLLFANYTVTIPLLIPIAFQVPLALILSLLMPATRHQEQVRAVCVVTDGEGSTALGQRVAHEQYVRLLRRYNQELSRPVRVHSGAALDPEGDGFVSVWCGRHRSAPTADIDPAVRLQACITAIEIAEAANRFELNEPDGRRFPARLGLTLGTVTIDSDADRGVFNVIGDAVNVAAKLQKQNNAFGSRVLASEDVVKGLETELHLRAVGTVVLDGVASPPVIFEILGLAVAADQPSPDAVSLDSAR